MDYYSKQDKIQELLENLSEALDITDTQYNSAVESYTSVGTYLSKDDSPLAPYSPDILPQGSFLLGTMIKPVLEDDELDIDLVCRLTGKAKNWAQYHLKQTVGERLKSHKLYKSLLDDEGRRCWTLNYADSRKFHMDILPSLVGQGHKQILEKGLAGDSILTQAADIALRITDTEHPQYHFATDPVVWQRSNPFGYALWFEQRCETTYRKAVILEGIRGHIQSVPEIDRAKTPLQRVVQILKRHRDISFGGDEDKPISIIITTLAARSYNHEPDLKEALVNVVSQMGNYIKEKYSFQHKRRIKWVENPINPEENFADKWPETPEKEVNFYKWLGRVRTDLEELMKGSWAGAYQTMRVSFGNRTTNKAFRDSGLGWVVDNHKENLGRIHRLLPYAGHKEPLKWPENTRYYLSLSARQGGSRNWEYIFPSQKLKKGVSIQFVAETDVPRPYKVYWQVVNNGNEAEAAFGLRGRIFESQTRGRGGLRRSESTLYAGTHWIECFIVKEDVCVARSKEFVIEIE